MSHFNTATARDLA